MKALKHYFISDDLDDLDFLEDELEHAGIDSTRICVFSNDSVSVANDIHLHAVQSIFTRDVVHCSWCRNRFTWCLPGVGYDLRPGSPRLYHWLDTLYFPVCGCDGFCTWEGGFVGMQKQTIITNNLSQLWRMANMSSSLDLDPNQEKSLSIALQDHPKLLEAATEVGSPHWILASRHWLTAFIDRNLFTSAQQKTHLN